MPARLSFIHLSGGRRGAVEDIRLPATLGSLPDATVRVPGVAARHCLLFERDGDVVLRDEGSDQGTFLAGEAVQEAVLRDGDVIELGPGGPKLRFRREGQETIPLLQALAWARPEGPDRLSDGTRFLRVVTREAVARTSRTFRWAMIGALAALGVIVGWNQWQAHRLRAEVGRLREALRVADLEQRHFHERIERERERTEADRRALETRIEDYRQREDELNRRLAEAASGEVQAVKDDLAATRKRLATLEAERAAGERVIREYGPGVCLIQGSYAFHDSAGRALRYKLDESGRPVRNEEGEPELDPMNTGPVFVVEYFGTGFLFDRRGLVMTNRHVAEPWWNDGAAQALSEKGFAGRFQVFRAFFPQEKEPFALAVDRVAESVDLAIVRLDPAPGRRLPVLPLDRSGRGAVPGQPVVVVGYPAGLEAILAKADSAVVKEILAASGNDSDKVTEDLARRGLIRPSTTQGHIGDITATDIVFDAPTTQGGSGGPVLNRNGIVIGVEYAVLSKFGGNSFAVPMSHVLDLLRERGKKVAAWE
jgi:S1-C subfamily serine protease